MRAYVSKDSEVRARIESRTKKKGEAILKRIGLDGSTYIRMCYNKLIEEEGVPFDIKVPNKETISAIQEIESIISGKKKAKSYKSLREFLNDVKK